MLSYPPLQKQHPIIVENMKHESIHKTDVAEKNRSFLRVPRKFYRVRYMFLLPYKFTTFIQTWADYFEIICTSFLQVEIYKDFRSQVFSFFTFGLF